MGKRWSDEPTFTVSTIGSPGSCSVRCYVINITILYKVGNSRIRFTLTTKINSKILRRRKWKAIKNYNTFNTDNFTIYTQKNLVKIPPESRKKRKKLWNFAEKFPVLMLDARGPGIRHNFKLFCVPQLVKKMHRLWRLKSKPGGEITEQQKCKAAAGKTK